MAAPYPEKLLETFVRMSVTGMGKLIDPAVINLIYEFDQSPGAQTLARTLIEIYGAENFLLDKNKRRQILEYLSKEDANALLSLLGGAGDEDPWSLLFAMNLNQEKNYNKLLDFFQCQLDETVDKEEPLELKPSIENISSAYALFPHQELYVVR